jgi:hypothetical protein
LKKDTFCAFLGSGENLKGFVDLALAFLCGLSFARLSRLFCFFDLGLFCFVSLFGFLCELTGFLFRLL